MVGLWPVAVGAEAVSLLGNAGFLPAPRAALLRVEGTGATGPSLFAGRAGAGLFAPRATPRAPALPLSGAHGAVARHLRDLIARAEAGPKGYDAVQHGARVAPPRPPTALTLAEIEEWIAATPGQPHAIGRYQVIPATLRRLARALDLEPQTRFSPAMQDRMADRLLAEAGLAAALAGRMSRADFMHNLARIWAGLPTASGRSHYAGVAGNRATMTWAQFEAGMAKILPL
ncbi:hypothetical protein CKO19_09535 [Rhodovulum adriaticum]|nr:hypothetical protein [Rhodovulum adriaticum]